MLTTYPEDFLNSNLRTGELYHLVLSLGLEITETEFRNIITQLNLKFISPRLAFSGLYSPKELTIYYSTSDSIPPITQREVISALTGAFSAYYPDVDYGKSEGEVPGAAPLIPEKEKESRPLFSPEWLEEGAKELIENLKQGWDQFVQTVSDKTGIPEWAIPYLIGGSVITIILLLIALKTKPVVIIERKKS